MRTNFYIDGFNLYFGCLQGTPHKWLDLVKFCQLSYPAPANQLGRVRYFTARVSSRPNDPRQPERQAAYLRALGTLPELTIHYGKFHVTRPWMKVVTRPVGGARVWCPPAGYRHPLVIPDPPDQPAALKVWRPRDGVPFPLVVSPSAGWSETVEVERSEEKGSDVNLATYLLLDAFRDDYDAAVVVTNDPDQREAIQVVRKELGKPVLVIFPIRPGRVGNTDLKKVASRHDAVNPAVLAASQFPPSLTDSKGRHVRKPATW